MGLGRASSGGVYAAARRVVEAQPYSAAAHNMLGLACQARGQFGGALQAYSAGLDVCTDHYEGLNVTIALSVACYCSCCCCCCCSCVMWHTSNFVLTLTVVTTGWGTRDRIAGPLCLVQQEATPALGLQHALQLNLACALSLNSHYQDAVNKFRTLEDSGRHLLTALKTCSPP